MNRVWMGWMVAACCVGCVAEGPLDWCNGVYECRDGDAVRRVRPTLEEDGCRWEGFLLDADGEIQNGTNIWLAPPRYRVWGFTESGEVAVCAGDSCDVCVQIERGELAPPPSEPACGGRCTGSPRSCYSVSPGSCSSVDGCYLDIGSVYDSWDDECTGSPRSCAGYGSELSCLRQGCRWE